MLVAPASLKKVQKSRCAMPFSVNSTVAPTQRWVFRMLSP